MKTLCFEKIEVVHDHLQATIGESMVKLVKPRAIHLLRKLRPILPISRVEVGPDGQTVAGPDVLFYDTLNSQKTPWLVPMVEAYAILTDTNSTTEPVGTLTKHYAHIDELDALLLWANDPEVACNRFEIEEFEILI